MYDGKIIIPAIIVFAALVTFPIWWSLAGAGDGKAPNPKPPPGKEHCVESKEYMAAYHMDLLNVWRDSVVRDGNRLYESKTYPGEVYPMSLNRLGIDSCMGCHNNKAEFCDECHDYASVDPYCWDCHVTPDQASTRRAQ